MAIDQSDIDICLGWDETPSEYDGALMPPIVQTSLFAHDSFGELVDGLSAEHLNCVYTRGQNPTVAVLERKLAALEHGEACKCFASGMGAVSAILLGLLQAGDHVLFVNHIYGPTLALAKHLKRFGINHDTVLGRDPNAVIKALKPETKLIWMESPGTMLFRMLDVPAIVSIAQERDILTVLDNSWATPLFQKPIAMGVDLVVHSCTKYIAGHSDVVAGAIVTSKPLLEQIFYRAFLLNGAVLSPFDAWLTVRGMRTLPERMKRHETEALQVAKFLDGHKMVRRVFHPALGEDSDLAAKQLQGYSGLFSFELASSKFDDVVNTIDGLKRFRIGVSWGGVESIVISPRRKSNQDKLTAREIPPGLIRLSIGLEGADQLIEDLDRSLAAL